MDAIEKKDLQLTFFSTSCRKKNLLENKIKYDQNDILPFILKVGSYTTYSNEDIYSLT